MHGERLEPQPSDAMMEASPSDAMMEASPSDAMMEASPSDAMMEASPSDAMTTSPVAKGSFHPVDGTALGTAALFHQPDGTFVVTFEDFSIDSAAGAHVILVPAKDVTKDADVDKMTIVDLGALKYRDGDAGLHGSVLGRCHDLPFRRPVGHGDGPCRRGGPAPVGRPASSMPTASASGPIGRIASRPSNEQCDG